MMVMSSANNGHGGSALPTAEINYYCWLSLYTSIHVTCLFEWIRFLGTKFMYGLLFLQMYNNNNNGINVFFWQIKALLQLLCINKNYSTAFFTDSVFFQCNTLPTNDIEWKKLEELVTSFVQLNTFHEVGLHWRLGLDQWHA